MQTPRPVTPDVVDQAVFLEELDLAPDGRVAYVVRRTTAGIEYLQELWAVDMESGHERRLTRGPTDTHPRVAPDGRQLAFLGKRHRPRMVAASAGADAQKAGSLPPAAGNADEPKAQVWVLPLDGGEPWPLTDEEHGVAGFAWSPDGTRIAHWGWRGPARFLVGSRADGKSPTARHITVSGWRWNEVGHVDYRTHLSVIDVHEDATSIAITEGDYDVSNPAWDADGRSMLFASARHDLADLYPRPGIWRVGARAAAESLAEPVEILRLRGVAELAVPSPDGRWLAVVGVDEDGAPDDAAPGLFLARADGSGTAVAVAPNLDLPIGAWHDTDLNGWLSSSTGAPVWREADGGTELVALVTRRGRCDPWRFPFDLERGVPRGVAEPLAEGDAACWQLGVAGPRVAVLGTLRGRAMEVMEPEQAPAANGPEIGAGSAPGYRTLSTIGSAWQQDLEQPRMELLSVPGPGGPIDTWVAHPSRGAGPGSAARGAANGMTPLVVDIHGGPLGSWAPAPSLEVQMLTSAGYTVALPNIRGSASYGREWIKPHMGRWGDVDEADVIAVVDHLVAAGIADPVRVGLLGLSYGGFMVNWLVGAHPGRFKAAVSENGVTDQVAAWGMSDSGPDYNRRANLGEPFDNDGIQKLWQQSPLRLASRITTPLLLLQAEADLRCPPQDNEQLFLVLRALGRTVEYVLYPESAHTYAITGRPDRRKDRHTRMLDWFERYLR